MLEDKGVNGGYPVILPLISVAWVVRNAWGVYWSKRNLSDLIIYSPLSTAEFYVNTPRTKRTLLYYLDFYADFQ
jgi:hypothetical protein